MADYGSYHAFVSRFVRPLVKGGRVEVEGLLGPGVLRAWLRPVDQDASVVADVTGTARTRLAKVGPVGHVDQLPVDALALAAAWHNLLAMTHPEVRDKAALRRRARAWTMELLTWAREPFTRAEVALRHAVLAALPTLGRVDTHVTFWAGYADFVGVAPPAMLVALPRVRRVREEKTRHGLLELLAALSHPDHDDDEQTELVRPARAAFAASPLTDLATADRPKPFQFAWTPPAVNALGDAALRGAAARVLLARGAGALRAVEQATLDTVRRDVPAAVGATLLRFHLELLCLDGMSSRHDGRGAQNTLAAQSLAWDALVRLRHEGVARVVGVDAHDLERALPIDPNRPVPKDPPSAPLLACARALEVAQ